MNTRTLLTIAAVLTTIGVLCCAGLLFANRQQTRSVVKTVSVLIGIWPSDTPTASRTPTPTLTPTVDPRIAARACLVELRGWSDGMQPVLQATVLLDEAYNAGNVDSALEYLKIAAMGLSYVTSPRCDFEFASIHSGYIKYLSLYTERIKLDLEGDSEEAEAKYKEAILLITELNARLGIAIDEAKKKAGVP